MGGVGEVWSMAKIGDLVKTYRLLSDPNAPDWNVKFIGAIAIVAVVIAGGAGAILWSVSHDATPDAPAASVQEPADDAEDPACELAPAAPTPATLPAECAEAPPGVLP